MVPHFQGNNDLWQITMTTERAEVNIEVFKKEIGSLKNMYFPLSSYDKKKIENEFISLWWFNLTHGCHS